MADRERNPQSEMPKADFITSFVLLGFSIAVIVLSLQMPRLEDHDINPWTVPGLVPGFLGVVIGIMALALLIRSIVQRGHRLGLTREKIAQILSGRQFRRATVTTLFCLLYAFGLVGWLPYPVSTVIFMFVFIMLFEYRLDIPVKRQTRTILLGALEAAIVAAAVSSLFHYIFLVRLP